MALVSVFTKRFAIPGEDGEWMDLRPLSFLEAEEAQTKGFMTMMRTVSNMRDIEGVFAEVARGMQKAAEEGESPEDDAGQRAIAETVEEVEKDPLSGFDQLTVLCSGIVAWSYEEEVNEGSIRLLDTETARWAAREIVGLRDKESLGNSSAPSTTT